MLCRLCVKRRDLVSEMMAQRQPEGKLRAFRAQAAEQTAADADVVTAISQGNIYRSHGPYITDAEAKAASSEYASAPAEFHGLA